MIIPAAVRNPVNIVWAILMITTLGSWWLGAEDGEDADVAQLATVGVLVLAFVKVQLVGTHFMELRSAPRVLQFLFALWTVSVCGGLVLLYLLG